MTSSSRGSTCSGSGRPTCRRHRRCLWRSTACTSTTSTSGRSLCTNAAWPSRNQIRDQRLVLPVRRLAADGLEAWAEVQRRGYEGLVAKEESAAYRRSTRWLKSKLRQDERFVIGGMAMARAGHQGGVLVGEWEGDRLLYRGFVDLGLSRGALAALRTDAQPLARPVSPFANLERRKDTVWLEPVLEAEVSYGRIVGGQLREPVLRRFVAARAHASPAQRPSRRHDSSAS
jgi:ATP-dependent DNA ligase